MRKLSIVIPAYNEEKGVGGVIQGIRQVMDRAPVAYELLIVDDGSTDATALNAEDAGAVVVRHSRNRGYGASLKTGILHASGDYVLIMDADGSYPPEEIPKLLSEAPQAHMVVGRRQAPVSGHNMLNRLAKRFLKMLASYLVETPIPDLNSGMRIFRPEDAKRYFYLLPSNFSFTTTITLAMLSNGMEVRYIPIEYRRRVGKSKIRPLQDMYNFLTLIVRTVVYFNPLKVFLPISLFLCASGFALLLWRMIAFGDIGEMEILALLSGLQIGFMGFLADVLVRRMSWLSREPSSRSDTEYARPAPIKESEEHPQERSF